MFGREVKTLYAARKRRSWHPIEGKRGMPMPRPPLPGDHVGFGKPTNTPQQRGNPGEPGGDYRQGRRLVCRRGDGEEQGDKVFCLAGKINRSGLVEIPMGTPLRTIIDEIGGGIPNKRKFMAQTADPRD